MKQYPDLNYPADFKSEENLESGDIFVHFIEANLDKYPIYFYNFIGTPDDFVLIPHGMLLRLYRKSDVPGDEVLARDIEDAMSRLKFDLKTERAKYVQFFADQIMLEYADRYYGSGKKLLDIGKDEQARQFFLKTLEIDKDNKQAIFSLGVSYIDQEDCNDSEETFKRLVSLDKDYWKAYEGMAKVYEQCYKDNKKRDEYLDKSKKLRESQMNTTDNKFKY